MVKGVQTKNYKKNPVVLLNHDYYDFPIGKAVGKMVWAEDDTLKFKIQFASEDENPKAGIAYKLFKGGYMNAFSLGFIPNFEKTEYLEDNKKGARRIFHEAELLEISAVSVPANQEALRASCEKAWAAGVLDGEELNEANSWIEKTVEDDKEEKIIEFDHKIVDSITANIEARDELTKALREAECKIAELTLRLKEQEMSDEDEWENYLAELFGEESDQASSSKTDANATQTDEELAREILNTLEEEENE
jgi:HK97 family phage prohead protease